VAYLVALVHAVDTDEARTSIGGRCLAYADRDLGRPRRGQHHPLGAVGRAVAQVVQVYHRDRSRPLEARVAEKRASLKVRAESMKVNAEFAAIERAPD